MNFSSLNFIIRFLPIFLYIYFIVPHKFKNAVLIIGSIVFYACGNLLYTPLLVGGIFVNFLFSKKTIEKKKWSLVVILLLNLSVLFYFKYIPEMMPGISFLVFQLLAFQISCYRGKITTVTLKEFFVYTLMFPKIIAGPITRYEEMQDAIDTRGCNLQNIEKGLGTFIIGLGYKVLLADQLSGMWLGIRTIGFSSISTELAWLGAVTYSLQLYFDFHGYSLMAIGLGQMLGFEFPENFHFPYMSKSVTEFYRRWHMTLGRWFKDIIYIPMGGSRAGALRTALNLFVVWLLTGLWHGISWNFLLWGIFLFLCVLIEKMFLGKFLQKSKVLSHIYLLTLIPISWMFFAITKLSDIPVYFSRMFAPLLQSNGVNVNALDYLKYGKMYGVFVLFAVVFALPWPENYLKKNIGTWPVILFLFFIFWFSVYEIAIGVNNPFLYFQF